MKPRARARAQPRAALGMRVRQAMRMPSPAPCRVLDADLRLLGYFDPATRKVVRLAQQRGLDTVRDPEGRV